MIKSFKNYRLLQIINDGSQWEKDYGDATTARVYVPGDRPRRIDVEKAFEAQESLCKME